MGVSYLFTGYRSMAGFRKIALSLMLILFVGGAEQVLAVQVPAALYRQLESVQAALKQGDYPQAERLLKTELARYPESSPAHWVLLQQQVYLEQQREQYGQALRTLAKLAQAKELDPPSKAWLYETWVRLLLLTEQPALASQKAKLWLQQPDPPALAYELLAYAEAGQNHYRSALKAGVQAVEMRQQQGKKIDSGLYQLLAFSAIELKQYRRALPWLKTLLHRTPSSRTYWLQLVAAYQNLGDERMALATLELARTMGALTTAADRNLLIGLRQQQQDPWQAARLLEQLLEQRELPSNSKSWLWLAGLWLQARDNQQATQAMKQLVRIDPQPRYWQQLALLQLQLGERAKAADSMGEALARQEKLTRQYQQRQDKGHKPEGLLPEPGQSWLQLGVMQFELGQMLKARTSFLAAADYPKARKQARQWLLYLDQPGVS